MPRPQYYIILGAVLTIGYAFTLQPSSAADRGSIYLVSGTFNNVFLLGLTPDKLIDMLGGPQFVKPARDEMRDKRIARIGSPFYYHDRGLSFYFYSPVTDEEERVAIIHVYVTKRSDN